MFPNCSLASNQGNSTTLGSSIQTEWDWQVGTLKQLFSAPIQYKFESTAMSPSLVDYRDAK